LTDYTEAFYACIFANLQQRDISGHLTKLWKQDPFKAKWTIVAKAYSRIRDLVEKANAPLDRFLTLACPAIGIIGVDDYLRKMNWSIQVANDGTINLHQTSLPFTATFEPYIMHTSMTDSDVITLVAAKGYISLGDGRAITNIASPPQGLLASAPVFQRLALPQPTLPPAATFLQTTITGPASAASMVLGFDVNDLLNSDPYEWTGSMSDLYNPNADSIDFQNVANNATANGWDVSSIHDPLGFESLFEGMIQGGYTTPSGKTFKFQR
jgi:hypothetical protein